MLLVLLLLNSRTSSRTSTRKMTTISPRNLSKGQLVSLVIKCTDFAARKHKRQKRMDSEGTPYINHPLGVANILAEEGDVQDPVVIISAILHDTVEDTETSLEEIEREFGAEVKRVVSEVTDDKTLPKMARKQLQIEHSPHISCEAKLVKLADKIYNLRDLRREIPVGWTTERAHEYFKWAEQVINGCRGTNERLEAILDELFTSEKAEHARQIQDNPPNPSKTDQ